MIADFQLDELQPMDSREAAAEDRKWYLHAAKVIPALNAAVLAGFLLCYFSNGFSSWESSTRCMSCRPIHYPADTWTYHPAPGRCTSKTYPCTGAITTFTKVCSLQLP